MTVEYHGPFIEKYYKVTVDGYEIPNVKVRKLASSPGYWDVVLDGRFSVTANEDELQRWLWILANSMAIAAGYTCHGEQSAISNPYRRRIIGLSMDEVRLDVWADDDDDE